ncbi:MAG: hypothetical protein ABI346_00570 [Candidatus Baltobacteraceae bacterium]
MTHVQSTADHLKNACSIVWRHRLPVVATFAVLMLGSVALITMMPRIYRASANVLIVNGNTRNDPTLSSPDLPTLVTSTGVLARVEKHLGLDVPLLTLKKNLSAKPPAYKSGIMRIDYSDPSRERAATIANGVADELALYYRQLSTARYDDDLSALDSELVKQKGRIERLNVQLNARVGAGSTPTDDKGQDSLVDQVNALRTQRALASADLQADAAQASALEVDGRSRSEQARRDILQSDPLYIDLLRQATSSSAELAAVRAQFTPRYPGLPALAAKVRSLKSEASRQASRALSSPHAFSPTVAAGVVERRKAAAVVAGDRAKVAALDGEIVRRSHQLDGSAPLALLRLERDAAMTQYGTIAAHRAATLLDRGDALSLGSVVVINRAVGSEAQAGVGPLRLGAIFALLSLLLALACAFLIDQLNPHLRRAAHIESLYGKPVIATLGKYL